MSSRSNASASSGRRRRTVGAARWVVLAFAAATLAAAPTAEAAKKKVVVLDFKGPKAAPLQKTVVGMLKKSTNVLGQAKFSAAAKKVKGFKANAAGVAKVARKLNAHAVVSGKVTKKKGKYKLVIQVREGRSGDYVGDDITVTTANAKLSKAQQKKVARELKALIGDLPDPRGGDEEEVAEESNDGGEAEADQPAEGDEEEVRVAGAEDRDKESEDKGGDEGGDAEAEEEDGGDEGEDEGEGEESDSKSDDQPAARIELSSSQKADMAVRGRAIDLVAGLSAQKRNLEFSFDGDVVDVPQGYKGGIVPSLYVLGEIYPMALVDKNDISFKRHLGLSFKLDKVLRIKSAADGMSDLPTSQTRFGVGVVYRWNFGKTPASPTLKIGAHFNKYLFSIDDSGVPAGTIETPSFSYTYLDPGLALRFPVNPKIAVLGEAHYLLVTSAGEFEDAAHYGTTAKSGFDIDLGGEYRLLPKLLVRGGVHYQRIGLTFDGDGMLTNRDADPEADVASAKDSLIVFYATAGYLF